MLKTENLMNEYKLILNERFERSVVSFLNSKTGGRIFIGVRDDGTVVGVENPDEVQRKISDRIKNNIRPETLGLYDIVLNEDEGKFFIEVIVSSGTEKPYYLKSFGMTSEGCLIRVGSQSQQMTQAMIENAFARRTRNSLKLIESFHQDLTFNQLKIYYEEHGKALNSSFAKTLDFLTPEGKYNILAFLFADQNDVSIKIAKYSGTDKIDLIENEEYGYCSILKSCDRVLDKLAIENRTFTKITAKDRFERKLFDSIAMREAVINAFVHNDYTDLMSPVFEIFSDRLEITSYGGLIDGMTQEELFEGCSRPRNREIMRIFKDVDKVEQLGSGMKRILKSYKIDIFRISPNFFHVVLYFDETTTDDRVNDRVNDRVKLSESEKEVLYELKKNPHATAEYLCNYLKRSEITIRRCFSELKKKGLIERVGADKNGHWKVVRGE